MIGHEHHKSIVNKLSIIIGLYVVSIFFAQDHFLGYMVWNIMLAAIPFYMAVLIYRNVSKGVTTEVRHKVVLAILSLIWFLFYPNTSYIITDLIHIQSQKFIVVNPNYTPYSNEARLLFNPDFALWHHMYTIVMGVFIAVALSFVALYVIQQLLADKWNRTIGWSFVITMQLLSGFAIYLGRFIRWNSWDILTDPSNILVIITRDIHLESIQFTLLFGTANLVIYIILYVLVHRPIVRT
ncbi:DUF1361 domain-containing protein [Paenibacillus sp. 481]|uniref:DUF1361 domain-containing protein n=1 Tax=Paenibacillus sp. 481 TaxID=2835869 RepID=UPI001E5DFF3F|nr:DUF1361 domain-containing protein [Paenibacillus sp. 481]UHA73691.1 DUF1361 domain-containing protein [Paenibacillus sp. 481]